MLRQFCVGLSFNITTGNYRNGKFLSLFVVGVTLPHSAKSVGQKELKNNLQSRNMFSTKADCMTVDSL